MQFLVLLLYILDSFNTKRLHPDMEMIKKILFGLSIFALYFTVKEMLELFYYMQGIDPYLGYITLVLIFAFLVYFVFIPIYKIVKIRAHFTPVTDAEKIPDERAKRIAAFKKNKFLLESGFEVEQLENDEASYERTIAFMKPECNRLRRKYVNDLFYSAAISQNGFLDAVLILSASVTLVKEIFILYQGRVNNRDLFSIAKNVYYSVAIAGSEGADYLVEEIYGKLATDTMKHIPFANLILKSVADGYISAAMLTRVSLITENYCTKLYISHRRELYPRTAVITSTTRSLTEPVMNVVKESLVRISKEQSSTLGRQLKKGGSAVAEFFTEVKRKALAIL